MGFVDLALKGVPRLLKTGPKVLAPLGAGAALAVGAGTRGIVDVFGGRRIRKDAAARLDVALSACEAVRLDTQSAARAYGGLQIQVHKDNVGRFADWLERNEALVRRLKFRKVDGVRIRVPSIPEYVAGTHSITTGAAGVVSAVGAGVAAPAAAIWGVSTFAAAGTGTAIASLGGVAAQNATLAALGGGTLAAGGGGMAAGATVLSLTAAVPVLLVGGFTIGIIGAKSKTESRGFAASVNLEVERIGLAQDMLGAVQRRIEELRDLLGQIAERATTALDVLEAVEFDPELHASEFLRALQLVTEVKEILNTPVLDPKSGKLTEDSIEILRKYA
jgi:hypothetical protein